jgi:DNA replication licensing factor MCM6
MAHRQLQRRNIAVPESNNTDTGPTSVFSSTMLVNFADLLTSGDVELAEAIREDFVRFEPFLQRAIAQFVHELHPELLLDASGSQGASSGGPPPPQQQQQQVMYFVAMHNMPTVHPVRALKMEGIGKLASVMGTVTRSSEVRPELLVGSFRCQACGLVAVNVAQQYHYTRPSICRNPQCHATATSSFVLEASASTFCDWQKLRVQENSNAMYVIFSTPKVASACFA